MTKLIKVNELYNSDKIAIVKKENEFIVLLNQEPKKDWILKHPFAKGVEYLPIERVEFLLTAIFIKWRVEIKNVLIIANSVTTIIRLHVKDPITDEWDWQDGMGAAPIQTDKGAGANDWTKAKTDGVMKAAPASESYAIKDAAEKFGKIFGKDLNRKNSRDYDVLADKFKVTIQEYQLKLADLLDNNQDTDQTNRIRKEIIEAEDQGVCTPDLYERLIAELLTKKL